MCGSILQIVGMPLITHERCCYGSICFHRLYTCEADLEKASNTIESCRHDIKERDAKIHRLSSELRLCFAESERLQKLDGQHQRAQDRLRQEAEFRMLSFRVSHLSDAYTAMMALK